VTRDDALSYIIGRTTGATEALPCHWINCEEDDWTHDAGTNFCRECAESVIEEYREDRPDLDEDGVRLDGGWATEHDSTPFCEICGDKLDGFLTDYGVERELEHFEDQHPRSPDGWQELYEAVNSLDEDHACWQWVGKLVRRAQIEDCRRELRAAKLAARPGMAEARGGLLALLSARVAAQAHKPSFRLWAEMHEYMALKVGERDLTPQLRARERRLRREAEMFLGNLGYRWGALDCFNTPYGCYFWPFVVMCEQYRLWGTAAFHEGVAARKRRRKNEAPYPDGSAEREAWESGYRCAVRRRS
jgi:hypothetical protein